MKQIRVFLALSVVAAFLASPCYADQCIICHPGDPPEIITDCLASGCHDTYDNGNHHATGWANAGKCAVCHVSALVADYDDEHPLSYPATTVTPTVQSCANCHKAHGSPLDGNGDPYPHPIYETETLEHMDFQVGYPAYCTLCHGDPATWDSEDPYLIRYCETCHNVDTLHTIPGHVAVDGSLPYGGYWYDENEGWTEITEEARCIACHSEGGGPAPDTMAWVSQDVGTFDTKYSELLESDCRDCHGESLADRHHVADTCDAPESPPVINTNACEGMFPVVGARMAHVTLTGTNFGNNGQASWCGDYKVQLKRGPGDWVDVPVTAWTDTLIQWALPPRTFEQPYRGYKVRVKTPTGNSNKTKFKLLPAPVVDRIEDDTGGDAQGAPGGWVTVYSPLDGGQGTFNSKRKKWYEDPSGGECPKHFGTVYVVTLTSSEGPLCAKKYADWNLSGNKDSFRFKLDKLWLDDDGDYKQDNNEQPYGLTDITPGIYAVQVCLVVYADSNGNDKFSGNKDTIYQVVKSQPDIVYEITPP